MHLICKYICVLRERYRKFTNFQKSNRQIKHENVEIQLLFFCWHEICLILSRMEVSARGPSQVTIILLIIRVILIFIENEKESMLWKM